MRAAMILPVRGCRTTVGPIEECARRQNRDQAVERRRCRLDHNADRLYDFKQVLREVGAGVATEEILAAHPRLTTADIRAAQAFAADWLAEETVSLAEA